MPLETRQALEDGHTDFERILPGPNRMYPDTDSPPQRITSSRVEALREALPERPWHREERYGAAGVAPSTTHFLIRRGGTNLVDRIVAGGDIDLRKICIFVGEELRGLQRKGVAVDAITEERWLELFKAFQQSAVLWEARHALVASMAANPEQDIQSLIDDELGSDPGDWAKELETLVQALPPIEDHARRHHYLMGPVLPPLRGRVPATEVAKEIERWTAKTTP